MKYDIYLNKEKMDYYKTYENLSFVEIAKLLSSIINERNKAIENAFEKRFPGLYDAIKEANTNQISLVYQGKLIDNLDSLFTIDPELEKLIDNMFKYQRKNFKY